jgi:hypothetical protein
VTEAATSRASTSTLHVRHTVRSRAGSKVCTVLRASALKFERHATRHGPPDSKEAWFDLASTLGIPQEHLELILARIWSKPVEMIRRLYRGGRH